jgi:hypothetical protein
MRSHAAASMTSTTFSLVSTYDTYLRGVSVTSTWVSMASIYDLIFDE